MEAYKKVAVLHPQMRISGGGIKMMMLCAQELSKIGHQTTFFTFSRSEACFPEIQKQIPDISLVQGIGKVIRLAWQIRKYDTIICGNPPMQFVGVLARIFGSNAHIVWWHHHIPWYYRGKYQIGAVQGRSFVLTIKGWIEKNLVIPYIDTHWATSKYVQKSLQDYAKLVSTIVYPVLDDSFLVQKKGAKDTLKKEKYPILVTHGRLVEGKGYTTLFSVYETVKKDFPDAVFWVMGDGNKRQQFEQFSTHGQDVTFFGQCSTQEICDKYREADVAIFGSRIDAFGMSALESQALGIDTVVLDAGGAKEAVVDPMLGHLVSDADAMVHKIRDVLGGDSKKGKGLMSTDKDVYFHFRLSSFSSFLGIFMQKN